MTPKEKAKEYLSTPEGFALGVLGFKLNPKQKEIVNEFDDLRGRKKVAVSAPNGAGKSKFINATIILRTICTKPQAKVIVLSADARQIDNQVWPAVEAHKSKMPEVKGWKWRSHDHHIESPEGGFVTMFTTDDPGRAEGWHCEFDPERGKDSPCVIICDEAKSISEKLFGNISARCTFNGLLYISSTGLMTGSFYDAMCGKGNFKRYSLGLNDCPHISKQRIDELIKEYKDCPNHPLLRSTLHGEFMDFTGDAGRFVTLTDIQSSIKSPPQIKHGDTVAFCDFAGGGAENVLAVRRGNKVEIIRAWIEPNEMVAIGQFIMMFRQEGLRQEEIWGDNCGVGKAMINRFSEVGWNINRFNGNDTANRDDDFSNRNAEVWETAGREIKKGNIILPDDNKLHSQMVDRHRTADSRGRIKCESKEDMAKRNVASPDRADAVIGCIACNPYKLHGKRDVVVDSWMDYIAEQTQDDAFNLPGADLGQ